MPLPKPNVTCPVHGQETLSEEDVHGIICNPIYTGMGSFPQILTDEEFIRSAVKELEEEGAEQFFVNMLFLLRETMKETKI